MLENVRRHKRKLIIIVVCLLVVGLLYGFRRPILVPIGNYLVIQDELRKGDLIAVMPNDWQRAEYGIPPDSRFYPESWWTDEYSLKALFEEYVKLGFYSFNYR